MLAFAGPIGKLLIKKSAEYSKKSLQEQFLNGLGLFVLIAFSPIANIASYYYADNAVVAPIAASGVLVNLLLAKLFLEEGKHMDKNTVLGILAFIPGLFLLVFTNTALADNKISDENIDWGILVLFFACWVFTITVCSHLINWFPRNETIQLFGWSVLSAVFASADIIASLDKWIYNHERDNQTEMDKGILASVFYAFCCGISIFTLNHLLIQPSVPMHIVATVFSTVNLLFDVLADCFVFKRYEIWNASNYIMAITGLFLMIVGIIVLQLSNKQSSEPSESDNDIQTTTSLNFPKSLAIYEQTGERRCSR